MIVDLKTIKTDTELASKIKDISDEKLIKKLKAIEKAIRKHTNNNFMDIKFRTFGKIQDNLICVNSYPYFLEGDNIEISHSLNNDVYTIKEISQGNIAIAEDVQLFDCQNVMITKVVYPEDIQEGVINMLKWDFGLRNKVGIKSETLSRHSVTYFDMDASNSLKGYPISLLGFLEDYMKARF